jgi:hypothetical protein|nr:MAG TPA: hypothetical protein [Caudoviricetes sp.]
MSAKELQNWINGLTQDITFEYLGVEGSICPFSRTDISISYGDSERTFQNVEDAMNIPFIAGKPLKEICDKIEFD